MAILNTKDLYVHFSGSLNKVDFDSSSDGYLGHAISERGLKEPRL